MTGLKKVLGHSRFMDGKNDFLNCLTIDSHICSATVKFVVAKKVNNTAASSNLLSARTEVFN